MIINKKIVFYILLGGILSIHDFVKAMEEQTSKKQKIESSQAVVKQSFPTLVELASKKVDENIIHMDTYDFFTFLEAYPPETAQHLIARKLHLVPDLLFNLRDPYHIKMTLMAGADPNNVNIDMQTVFNYYINKQRPESARTLLEFAEHINIALPDYFGISPLMNAIKEDYTDLVQKIIDLASKMKNNNEIMNQNSLSINENQRFNINFQTPLTLAVKVNPSLIPSLIEHGSDPKLHDSLALRVAVLYNANALEQLFNSGVDVNTQFIQQDNTTPLMLAAYSNPSALPILIKSGANLYAEDKHGGTAANYAINNENLTSLDELIKAGYNINHKNSKGETALMDLAFGTVYPHIAEYLITKGADVNLKNNDGQTALTRAIIGAEDDYPTNLEVMRILLQHGALIQDIDFEEANSEDYPKRYSLLEEYAQKSK